MTADATAANMPVAPITVRYALTPLEILQTAAEALLQKRLVSSGVVILGILLIVSSPDSYLLLSLLSIGAVVAMYLLSLGFAWYRGRDCAETFDEEGLSSRTGNARLSLPWKKVGRVRQRGRLLVFQSDSWYLATVPMRALSTEDLEALDALLTRAGVSHSLKPGA